MPLTTLKVLIIKTSSLGDVIHTLPAVTDAKKALPEIEVDWLVEESFVDIPTMHPAISKVIPVALRRWRKKLWRYLLSREFKACLRQIRANQYDVIIDAQGLFKSSILTWLAKGNKHGLAKTCSRGKVDFAYQHKHAIPTDQHAIERVRQLFAQALGYPVPKTNPDYGITPLPNLSPASRRGAKSVIFLHGTTWQSKQYPVEYWQQLAKIAARNHFHIKVPAGNETERKRAEVICKSTPNAEVLPPVSLQDIASLICHASGIIAVDTGLAHLAAALGKPCVTIYGATNPTYIGTVGKNQLHAIAEFACSPCQQKQCTYKNEPCPPCYGSLPPKLIWHKLIDTMR